MNTCLLGDAIASSRSGFPSGKRSGDGVLQLRMNNVRTDGTLDLASVIRVPATKKQVSDLSLTEGDVLFNSTNSPELVGKTCLFQGFAEPVVFSNHFVRLRTRPERLRGDYLARWLTWTRDRGVFTHGCVRWVNQATFRTVNLFRLQIPLPPLAEQKRIARILDAADALRAKRREALAELDTLLQSTFLDMFGDPAGSRWTMLTVEAIASCKDGAIRTGPFGSQLLHSEFVDAGIRVLGIDNAVANEFREGEPRFITARKYEQLKRYTVRPRDVLITIMGTCGRCAVVPDDICTAINTKHLCCITLDHGKCLPEFMHAYFLEHPIARRYLERNAKGAIMSGLNMRIIKALPIPAAPRDLQQRFAAIVESVQHQKASHRAHLAELDTLFASLQSRAFRGDL